MRVFEKWLLRLASSNNTSVRRFTLVERSVCRARSCRRPYRPVEPRFVLVGLPPVHRNADRPKWCPKGSWRITSTSPPDFLHAQISPCDFLRGLRHVLPHMLISVLSKADYAEALVNEKGHERSTRGSR